MLMGRQSRRRGFTLIETVVTVGIVAALAAVVYPQVVKQFDSADPTRMAEDLNSIRTALDAFGVNVRPQQPGDIEDLVNRPFTDAGALDPDSTFRNAAYAASDTSKWIGPYLTAAIPQLLDADDAVVVATTGFGATIRNHFAPYDADAATGGAEVLTNATTIDFVAVHVSGLSGAAFNAVNDLIDGTTENTATKRRHEGRLRCPGAGPTDAAACTVAFYLAVPVR